MIAFAFSMPEVMDKYFDLVMEQGFCIELQQSPEELRDKGYKYVVMSGEYTYSVLSTDKETKLLYWPENIVQFHHELEQLGILAIYWNYRPLKLNGSSDSERENVKLNLVQLEELLTKHVSVIQEFVSNWKYIYQVIFTNEGIKFHQRKINITPEEIADFKLELSTIMNQLY